MRTSPMLPTGLGVRHLRDGSPVYFTVTDGRRHDLGDDLRIALIRWVRLRHQTVASSRCTTADLLAHAGTTPSVPVAAARHIAELAVLALFFVENNLRWLDEFPNQSDFLAWFQRHKRPAPADSTVRLLRRAWSVMRAQSAIHNECPWPSLDLRKPRLQLEAADVIGTFAANPLKRLLDTLLHDGAHAAAVQVPDMIVSHEAGLIAALAAAVPPAIQALTESGRTDLRPAVYRLKLSDLGQLAVSPALALARSTGGRRFERRATMLDAKRATQTNPDQGNSLALPDASRILDQEQT